MKKFFVLVFALSSFFSIGNVAHAQYTVERPSSGLRGHMWVGEGAAGVFSSNQSAANRFRFGGELQFGDDYRFIVGWTFLDWIMSGERSDSTGGISRRSTDFNFGYFVLPDKLWVMYSVIVQDISGDAVSGSVTSVGHQASVGYRFYSKGNFSLAVEGAYIIVPSYNAQTYNYTTSAYSSVKFPAANIWSLNLRMGFDVGS